MFALWASPDAAKSFQLLFLALQVKTHLLVLGLSCIYFFSSFQTERDCEKGGHIQMKLTNDPLCTFVDTWDEKVILMKKNVPWPALGFFGTSWW